MTRTDLHAPRRQPLDAIFAPRRIAVVGASERRGSVGRRVMSNLLGRFGGVAHPISRTRASVLGVEAHRSLATLPEPPDLAIVAVPAAQVPEVIAECAAAGVRGAIVLSAGFREVGAEGARLEEQALAEARRGRVRIVGPNSLGVILPHRGLDASFASTAATPGRVAFLSQSGALLGAVLDWSVHEQVGWSALISTGSMVDVGWGELIHYLGDDPHTRSIVLYMEGIGDARSFLSAAREVAREKPIIVMKAGRSPAAAQAAATHTGSLAGTDAALDTAFRRTGVLRVDSVADLFAMAEVLDKQPRPRGPRLGIVTNAGGPGVVAADALLASGAQLAPLSEEAEGELAALLSAERSPQNPVDILGDASAGRYGAAMDVMVREETADGLLVVLAPQNATDAAATAREVAARGQVRGKPVLASFMGGDSVREAEGILADAGVPSFRYPDTAARVFAYMWRYSYNLRGIYEIPMLPEGAEEAEHRDRASAILDGARAEGRTLLDELESKEVLAAYGIPTVETRHAADPEAAVEAAERFGYPVVVKLHSHQVAHKSDVGGVRLRLRDAASVRDAFEDIGARLAALGRAAAFEGVTVQPMVERAGYELLLGSANDPQLGPVLLFGTGGTLAEVHADRALGLPPLNTTLARRMMEQTRIYPALRGVRGLEPVDLDALEATLVRFSQLVAEQPWIDQIDLNPLLAAGSDLLALDARIVLHDPTLSPERLPRTAIRPYPRQYVGECRTSDGSLLTLRPIRPEDEPALVRFHRTLSADTVHMRYSSMMSFDTRTSHERLSRTCFVDYDREMVLVAETGGEIVGVGRLNRFYGTDTAEFAVLLGDPFQGRGLGSELLRRLLDVGRTEGLSRVVGYILPQNAPMLRTVRGLGFDLTHDPEDGTVVASRAL